MSAENFESIKPNDVNKSNCSKQNSSNDTRLTTEELDHLCSVMLRAKNFNEETSKVIEGQLYKYINLVKGWQYRWLVINRNSGILEYYYPEDRTTPRGSISLVGCEIIPSDEDSKTFSVNSLDGQCYKLKASDAKERQIWVDNLRIVAQMFDTQNSQSSTIISDTLKGNNPVQYNSPLTLDLTNSLNNVRNQLQIVKDNYFNIVNLIEDITCTDEHLLLLKITAKAATDSLERCLYLLESLNYK